MGSLDWRTLVAIGALVVSVMSFVLSWLAFRQRARYHPQPKLVEDWSQPTKLFGGVPLRQVALTNHGDASARDLTIAIGSSVRRSGRWDKRAELEPGETWTVMVPLATGVVRARGGMGTSYSIADGGGKPYRPRLLIEWRQAPFHRGKRRLVLRAPVE
ncbi:hypothetical protein [Microbacterium sp. USTB-Y]|uniref:hypothetical protein n=1 Tax=Microbacterium sp. USTB-Y TaxID=2823692 RepID=UPI0020408378|nr:hypothetical protein [Microbacterium sp. USTB-Y]